MKAKLLTEEKGQKSYVLIFDTGDKVVATLLAFARERRLAGSHITAIGAFQEATLGYFNWDTKKYQKIPIHEQVELLSLIGDIALAESGEPNLHAHVVVGKSDGMAMGGHLIEAVVRPTLEVVLTELPAHLQRRHDPQSRAGADSPVISQPPVGCLLPFCAPKGASHAAGHSQYVCDSLYLRGLHVDSEPPRPRTPRTPRRRPRPKSRKWMPRPAPLPSR